MSPRPLTLLLACLALLGACAPSEPPPPVELGRYALDQEASLNASLPVWTAAMDARFEEEIGNLLPQAPRSFVLEKQRKLEETRAQLPEIVRKELERVVFEAEIDTRRRYRLDYSIPAVKGESSCSGRWQWVDEEVQFLRQQVDDQPADPVTMLRARWVDDSLHLSWPGLDLVFVLTRQQG